VLHLGLDIVVPDLAGWRRERLPHLPKAAFFSLAPDWICEVLSPSTAARVSTQATLNKYP
jgi:Uma2 family endonuclease